MGSSYPCQLDSRRTPNAALLIDAAGCFTGAAILVLSPTTWSWTDLPENWRVPVAVALFAFSVLLVIIARYRTRPLITLAVLGNIAWIIAGAIALFVTGTVTGAIIIATIMLADAIMAWFQSRGLHGGSVVSGNNTSQSELRP